MDVCIYRFYYFFLRLTVIIPQIAPASEPKSKSFIKETEKEKLPSRIENETNASIV